MKCIVAGAVIIRDGRYLLVQEAKESARGLWNWPAGRLDEGETAEEGAIREVQEETGFLIQIKKKIGEWPTENTPGDVQRALFLGEILSGELQFPKDELLDAKWFSKEEIYAMKDKLRTGWIIEAIEKLQ